MYIYKQIKSYVDYINQIEYFSIGKLYIAVSLCSEEDVISYAKKELVEMYLESREGMKWTVGI